MEIIKATKNDVETIQHLAETIWPTAYANIISAEQIQYMLHLIYSKDALIDQLNKGHQFILAVEKLDVIGFAAFSTKSDIDKTIFRLHKIYTLPNQNIKGIGSFLLTYIINICKAEGGKILELNVNKYNSAKSFYLKKGFTIISEAVIEIGNGYVMDDFVMGLNL